MDIDLGGVFRVENGQAVEVAHPGGGPNGSAFGSDGALWVVNCGGYERPLREMMNGEPAEQSEPARLERIDLATGEVEVVLSDFNGEPFAGLNDIAFDSDDNCYFTDSHGGNVYFMNGADRTVTRLANGMRFSNGICVSEGGDKLYVADTLAHVIYQHEVLAPGMIGPRAGFAVLPMVRPPWPATRHGADGLKTGSRGTVHAAGILGGEILSFDSDGSLLDRLEFSGQWITNLAFAPQDAGVVYVTDAEFGRVLARRSRIEGRFISA